MYKEQIILKIYFGYVLKNTITISAVCSMYYIVHSMQVFCVKSPDGLLYLPNVQYRMEHTVLGNVSHNATCSTWPYIFNVTINCDIENIFIII